MTDAQTRRRTALHESSHAIVGYALGWRIRTVVVAEGGGSLGFCEHHRREDLSPMALAIDDVTILLAGRVGEMLEPMSGYAPDVDDDEDAIKRAVDKALGALPHEDGAFVYAALHDDRPDRGDDDTKALAIALQVVADEAAFRERGGFLEFCGSRATRYICSHVAAILALAEELSRRPILAGAVAEAIIERAEAPTRGDAA